MGPKSPRARGTILGAIAVFPLLMLTVLIWAVNRSHPYIGPFPFLLFWITAWVFLTPFFMAVVYFLDHRWQRSENGSEEPDADDGGDTHVG